MISFCIETLTDFTSVKKTVSKGDTDKLLLRGGFIMPRGDGTGPNGLGQMTGRAMGYCAGYSLPGFSNGGFGRGLGRFGGGSRGGRGGGRGIGFRNRYYANGPAGFTGAYYPNVPIMPQNITAEQEAGALKNQATLMQDDLNALNQRIQELEKLEAEKERSKK